MLYNLFFIPTVINLIKFGSAVPKMKYVGGKTDGRDLSIIRTFMHFRQRMDNNCDATVCSKIMTNRGF
jgi:hypothetical protein